MGSPIAPLMADVFMIWLVDGVRLDAPSHTLPVCG